MSEDSEAIAEILRTSEYGAVLKIEHYLYFPGKSAALKASAALESLGYRTDSRLGADDRNWLVLANHQIVLSVEEFARVRAVLQRIAEEGSGEYDGWEVAVER